MSTASQNAIAGPSHSGGAKCEHARGPRRIFIGPMPYAPEKVEPGEEQASNFAAMHGFRIFLRQGGRVEDWTETKAREYKQRLKERILESTAWYANARAARKRRKTMLTTEWRGETFEVGKVAGVNVNMLAEDDEELPASKQAGPSKPKAAVTVHWDEPPPRPLALTANSRSQSDPGQPERPPLSTSAPSGSFVTAESYLSATSAPARLSPSGSAEMSDSDGEANGGPSTSRSHLIGSAQTTAGNSLPLRVHDTDGTSKPQNGLKSILRGPGKVTRKGKVKLVEPTSPGDQSPASPAEVLDRAPDELQNSSAAAAAEASDAIEPIASGSVTGTGSKAKKKVLMRDKMLVRVFRSDNDNLKFPFTETECRVARGVKEQEWGEFLLVWRKNRIELYEEYSIPFKERFTGHKHLAFVIPLQSGTKLSLFSPVDMSFCLICPPTPTREKEGGGHRWHLHRAKEGLNVFVLRPKSRSRAVDWIWNLWRELGDSMPGLVEVMCPLIHTRVRIQIPDSGEDDWKAFTRDNIIDLCSGALKNSFAWKTLMELPILNGRKLELGWRSDIRLDWVWLRNSVEGQKRDWEILYGVALQQLGNAFQLELHVAEHYPSYIVSKNGRHIEEPPAIEGYVYITKKRSRRNQAYLSTHDGFLCSLNVDKAIMPPPPTDVSTFSKTEEDIQKDERRRLRLQLVHARGFWDMRDVLVVRRASHPAAESGQDEAQGPRLGPDTPTTLLGTEDEVMVAPEPRRSDSDIEDEGGDSGMAKVVDKPRLKLHRSFEMVLKNGKVLRFETHSTKHSVEWVTHLRALVSYWKKRHRDDTVLEMNIINASLGSERITISHRYDKKGHKMAHSSADPMNASEYLSEYWNWCVLDGCRPVLKSGLLYTKSKVRGKYTLSHVILAGGWLIQFTVNDATLHNRQVNRINLIDSYICSGYYTALALSEEEYNPNEPPTARYFQDGLETKDATEDALFLLWYRPRTSSVLVMETENINKVPVQKLDAKRAIMICRARSRLERDAWCWALNTQIEKIVRASKEREARAREQGEPVS